MSDAVKTQAVGDSVGRVDNTIAVGEDLDFQRHWWKFERVVWIAFVLILVLDLLGLFGRGWLAYAKTRTADGSMELKYERVERTMTSSNMTVAFGKSVIRDGKVQLYVSESVLRKLGALRIAPQPESSVIGRDGVTYTFLATEVPASIDISLEPSAPGVYWIELQVPGHEALHKRIIVVP